MNQQRLRGQLAIDEGRRSTPYRDTVGIWTVGIGHNMERGLTGAQFAALFEVTPMSEEQIDWLFARDFKDHVEQTRLLFSALDDYTDARQEALVNMMFNLGYRRLSRFVKMRGAIELLEWDMAADEAKDSSWYGQVGQRAERIVYALRHGEWEMQVQDRA